jgi:hypothetical protein
MPAEFRVEPQNFQALINELRNVDKELVNEFRREFRSELKPYGNKLRANIPSKSPLSGFTARKGAQSPYIYSKPTVAIDVKFRGKGKQPRLVSLFFNDRRPNAGFSILETAGSRNIGKDKGGMTQRGLNMVTGLATAGYSLGKGGRWVIPQFYSTAQSEMTAAAKKIIVKFANKVNLKLRDKGGA